MSSVNGWVKVQQRIIIIMLLVEYPGKLKVHHYHIHRTEGNSLSLPNGHSNGFANGIGGGAANGNSTSNSGGGGGGGGVGGAGEAQFYLSEKHAFPTISDVIHYHKHNSGGLVVRLRSPPVKDRESPVTAGMGLDEFELDPAELQIDRDPIGKGQFGVGRRRRRRLFVQYFFSHNHLSPPIISQSDNQFSVQPAFLFTTFGMFMQSVFS
ncbi:unnamed protein product [Dibothriocephalus latus]|uniref:SH2 domain-containing protein n=1 Tax=Dibothriocephalus latus TaxID=60516 RepID=A0A3P7NQP2_DIBLA|nr:unnamed protein product [Dibothriocephalus latus]